MSRLSTVVEEDGGEPMVVTDGQDFRSLASELGVVLAPRLLAPADTLGFGGFQFAGDLSFTTISNDEDFWRAREASSDPSASGNHGGSLMPTLGLFARKGIWLPLPSFEVGIGIIHLLDSNTFAAQGYAKLALHEGYHDLPLPSIAVRGAASRMMGAPQLDLTIASIDVSLSKAFGISGTFQLEPFGGWNALIIVPRSEVIDPTPHMGNDDNLNFVFRNQDSIFRNRFFMGFKVQYYIFAVIVEANITLKGTSADDQPGTDNDSADEAGLQQAYTVAIGMDF
ncbi:MAG: hypothetical protein MJE77_18590 [Proteobacteria bacterium]|nr:hypothetical protein [Pseudomonadota bacterium]